MSTTGNAPAQYAHDPYAAALYEATQESSAPSVEPVVYPVDVDPVAAESANEQAQQDVQPEWVAEAERIVIPEEPSPEPAPPPARHTDDVDDADSDDDDETDSTKAAAPEKARRSLITKAVVKRILERAETLHLADARTRLVLSALLGTSDDVADMVSVIMSAPRTRVGVLNSLAQIAADATENPINATVTAMSLDRRQSKRIWAVLGHLGVLTGAYPANEAVAAGRIVEATAQLDDEGLRFLDEIRELMKK